MITPVTLANAIADAVGLDDLVPPFIPGRIGNRCAGAIRTRARLRRQRRAPMICPHSQAVSAALAKSLSRRRLRRSGGRSLIRRLCGPASPAARASIKPGRMTTARGCASALPALEVVTMWRCGCSTELRADAHAAFWPCREPPWLRRRRGHRHTVGVAARPDQPLYSIVARVGGKLAGFGQRMLDGVVRVLLASFFERTWRGHARRAGRRRPSSPGCETGAPCCGC